MPWISTPQPLETACAAVLNINISPHTVAPSPANALPTISDLRADINRLDDLEYDFTKAYIKHHARIHDLDVALRILETTIATVHPQDYDGHKFMHWIYLNATRESIQVVRDGIRWVRKLRTAVEREADVAEGAVEARLTALEERLVVQAEGREPRGAGTRDAAGSGGGG